MKHNLECDKNCIVCNDKLSMNWRRIMVESEFIQSWCKTCILKYGHSFPMNNLKLDSIHQINKLERILLNK
jgi:hypothetical protein